MKRLSYYVLSFFSCLLLACCKDGEVNISDVNSVIDIILKN